MWAGTAATRLARRSAPTATRIKETGTVGCGTALMSRAKRSHSSRPAMIPMGMPTAAETVAMVDACYAIAAANWRAVKPSDFKGARSRRRLTDAINVSASIAPTARPMASTTGVAPVDW